jgi:hypothetical protein
MRVYEVTGKTTAYNSGFAQRGDLCFKKSSSCLEVRVTFDTLEP